MHREALVLDLLCIAGDECAVTVGEDKCRLAEEVA